MVVTRHEGHETPCLAEGRERDLCALLEKMPVLDAANPNLT